jgi:hypothetical protein
MLDINTLAAWGEFIGGIAVVFSLLYLASQIRQNSRLLRTSTASASSAVQNNATSLVVQDPEVARIYDAGLTDRSSLSNVDRRRFVSIINVRRGLLTSVGLDTAEAEDALDLASYLEQHESSAQAAQDDAQRTNATAPLAGVVDVDLTDVEPQGGET